MRLCESMKLLSAALRSLGDFPLELSEPPVVYRYIFNISSDPRAQNAGLLKLSGGLFDRTIFFPFMSAIPAISQPIAEISTRLDYRGTFFSHEGALRALSQIVVCFGP